MKIKRIISASLVAIMLTGIAASASILGSETVKHSRLDIGRGAVLESNVFYSDQSGVGYQTEYFVEYTPNESLVPILVNDSIYGSITASSMADSLINQGKYPTMLMNSDFFALQTGIPLSHQVVDGKLHVMDTNDMDAVGINSDGTAFISWLSLNASFSVNGASGEIDVFNKLRQPYGIYMFDSAFDYTTMATTPGINVVVGSLTGSPSPGEIVEGIVETVTRDEGAVPIPQGKLVLSADLNCAENILNTISLLKEGDKVSITVTAEGDSRWDDAKYILGAWGGRIVRNSQITQTDEAAAPRTAFGIKADGTLIFYTLDGRKTGHSYGARLKTLAKRMVELGCVDAINLDGGGSTTIGAVYPGGDSFSIINKPSDGSERRVATFLGLINTASQTHEASKLFIYPYSGDYLSGATASLSTFATDDNYYKAAVPQGLTYTSQDGTVSYDGRVKITGDGTVIANAGALSASVQFNCYKTPTNITIRSSETGNEINSLNLSPGEALDLNASANFGHKSLTADDRCFTWACTGEVGTIDSDGKFTAAPANTQGSITVSAGEYTKTIPVKVTADKLYTSISFEEANPGEVSIIFDPAPFALTNENISLKADGKEVNTELQNNRINLVFSDNMQHHISVTAMNSGGYKTVAGYTVGGKEHSNIFADVENNHWAKSYITYMNYHGVVKGTSENGKTYFKPLSDITRGEFAVMIANILNTDVSEFDGIKTGLYDEASLPSWCINHIKALNELGIMTGKQSGDKVIFDHGASLTRAEAATVISRLLPDMIEIKNTTFRDSAQIPSWSRDAFKKLTSIGVINGYSDNTLRPDSRISRAEAIKMIYEIY